jgi:hypothetical protein
MQDSGLTEPCAAVRLQLDGPIFVSVENFRRRQPKSHLDQKLFVSFSSGRFFISPSRARKLQPET